MALSTDVVAAGVCYPQGFSAGVAAAGIRGPMAARRLDVALIVSDRPASAAGTFTRNLVRAAPVTLSQHIVAQGRPVRAIVVNAGNANACTGEQGLRDASAMCAVTAEAVGVKADEVLVCSTGVIGRPMVMAVIGAGIVAASASMRSDADLAAAEAIMTTDTLPKRAHAEFTTGGITFRVGGMAKGAGMIHPDMATLLVFLTTDAPANAGTLQPLLERATANTFNCVTVDGDTSTNDSVLLLANGAAGGAEFSAASEAAGLLEDAVTAVCDSLAEQVIADAEGATRYFRVLVRGSASRDEARRAARTVASSPLVKTAIHGADPNWGRIVAALGRSGVAFDVSRCTITIGDVTVFARGVPTAAPAADIRAAFSTRRIEIDVDFDLGAADGHAWGCDLTGDYVRINADYTT